MKPNDVILKSVTRVAAVIILTFSIYLFMNGHHHPGGGFIGGLSMASAIVLLYLSFGIEKVRENIRVDFKKLSAIGVLIAIGTGTVSVVFGKPFLTQTFGHVDLPIFGDTELASALIFDTGVALAVIGTAVNIILSISEDR
ncbi:multicomponent Na+:H+ antiporter subunit B [Paenibacillus anaericanus]|uniref:Na(+)/H(+) antiporter subunit B n=1 Tax=Paenibacillus anaericanus TaxID=170367 RepID=A0A433XV57_9BACL|nr:Na(+)/H(+) antiporter subunit B [Paenibacillus anaericanus]MDQ0091195.1 multicomponent Na+:H+ antiporter subunit B [Paenibacillus anaericanus]RUT38355.1 Na(+)/H(+) antiporter subunit B [Paenibacillus anaericanus]